MLAAAASLIKSVPGLPVGGVDDQDAAQAVGGLVGVLDGVRHRQPGPFVVGVLHDGSLEQLCASVLFPALRAAMARSTQFVIHFVILLRMNSQADMGNALKRVAG